MAIIDSIVFGIGTLPEAKIGPVKGMLKKERDSYRLHVLMRAGISPYTPVPWPWRMLIYLGSLVYDALKATLLLFRTTALAIEPEPETFIVTLDEDALVVTVLVTGA